MKRHNLGILHALPMLLIFLHDCDPFPSAPDPRRIPAVAVPQEPGGQNPVAEDPELLSKAKMYRLDETVLRDSKDPRELMKMAQGYAASEKAEDHAILLKYLDDSGFLSRMDDDEAYLSRTWELRLASVMQVLRVSPDLQAKKTIVELCSKETFNSKLSREELLIKSLATVRPAPPAAIEYWRERSTPEALFRYLVVSQVAKNGSKSAIELYEEIMMSPAHPQVDKQGWIRDEMLVHRYGLPMLEAAGRLIRALPADLGVTIVEAYYDYKPHEWYGICDPPRPQPLEQAAKEAHPKIRALTEYALDNLPLPKELKLKAKVGLMRIDREP